MPRISHAGGFGRAKTYIATYGAQAFAREVISRTRRRLSGDETPNRFHVEISNSCNFDCEYCVLREQATGEKVMSDKTFSAVLPYLRDASSVALSGLAEPLMNRRFTTFLRQVRKAAPHALISIDTNASLLTEQIARDMIESRLGSLVFSLDGADAELVDGIRQGGSLEGLIGKIQMLNRVKREMGSKLPILAATMVLQRKTLDQLPAVVELAASLDVRIVTINGLEPYGPDLIGDALWTHPGELAGEIRPAVEHAQRIAEKSDIDLRFPALEPQSPRCPQMGRPVILADGTVVPCSALAYHRDGFLAVDSKGSIAQKHTSTERLSFGNVNESPLAEIWTDPEYRGFRARVASGDFPTACDTCLLRLNLICPNEPLTAEQFISSAEKPA